MAKLYREKKPQKQIPEAMRFSKELLENQKKDEKIVFRIRKRYEDAQKGQEIFRNQFNMGRP